MQVTLAWDDLAKPEWVGEGGVDTLDPATIVALNFYVIGGQSGSVWVDDLQLLAQAPAAEVDGAPIIQYVYPEEGSTEGCHYLHWEVSEATAVYLNDEAVDNPGSSPEGVRAEPPLLHSIGWLARDQGGMQCPELCRS